MTRIAVVLRQQNIFRPAELTRFAMDVGLDAVDGADEIGDEARRRTLINRLRRVDLRDAPLLHHRDTIAERHRLLLIVRHVDGGNGELFQQRADLEPQPLAQFGVERRQRFVKQQHFRPSGQRARQRHALLLPAGKLVDGAIRQRAEIHQRQHFFDARFTFAARHALHLQAILDVLRHVHIGKQRVVLEHHADVALLDRQCGDVAIVKPDLAALVAAFQPADDAQRGGFAAAGRPEQHQGFAGVNGEIERVQRDVLMKASRAAAQRDGNGIVIHASSLRAFRVAWRVSQ